MIYMVDPFSIIGLIVSGIGIALNEKGQKEAKKDAWTRLAVGSAVGAAAVVGATLMSNRNKGKK